MQVTPHHRVADGSTPPQGSGGVIVQSDNATVRGYRRGLVRNTLAVVRKRLPIVIGCAAVADVASRCGKEWLGHVVVNAARSKRRSTRVHAAADRAKGALRSRFASKPTGSTAIPTKPTRREGSVLMIYLDGLGKQSASRPPKGDPAPTTNTWHGQKTDN